MTGYIADPALPPGDGWCAAVIPPRPIDNEPGNRRCATHARFERDGHPVCGIHRRAGSVDFGPSR